MTLNLRQYIEKYILLFFCGAPLPTHATDFFLLSLSKNRLVAHVAEKILINYFLGV